MSRKGFVRTVCVLLGLATIGAMSYGGWTLGKKLRGHLA